MRGHKNSSSTLLVSTRYVHTGKTFLFFSQRETTGFGRDFDSGLFVNNELSACNLPQILIIINRE